MLKLTRFRLFTVIAAVALGVLGFAPVASAATGPDGFTILHAANDDQAHVCNVVSQNDSKYQAVVCADLVTYEGASDYYVYARAEAYCQLAAAPHTEVACNLVNAWSMLATADGTTSDYEAGCGGSGTTCPDARINADTRTWDYTISGAANGACTNPSSSYDVWGLAIGGNGPTTTINTPDGFSWQLGLRGALPNDGVNQSTGHFYVCP